MLCCYQVVGSDAPTGHFLHHISGHDLHPADTILLFDLETIQHLHYLSVHHNCNPVYPCQSGVENLHKGSERGDWEHSGAGCYKMVENEPPLDTGLSCPDHTSCDSCVMVGFVDLGMQMMVGDGMAA